LSLNAFPAARTRFKDGDAVASFESGRALSALDVWNAQFGEWLLLEQASLSPLNVRPGDGLAVDLRWHALKKIPQPLQSLVTLRVLCVPATCPLSSATFFARDVGLFHLYRLAALDDALRQGELYPRLFPSFAFGYGQAVLAYYGPLSYYLAEVPHALGAPFPDA